MHQGGPIVGVCLGREAVVRMSRMVPGAEKNPRMAKTDKKVDVTLPRRAVYCFDGDAQILWKCVLQLATSMFFWPFLTCFSAPMAARTPCNRRVTCDMLCWVSTFVSN